MFWVLSSRSFLLDTEPGIVQRADEQSASILALQKELDNVREEAQRSQGREATRAQMGEEEFRVHILHDRVERELTSAVCFVASPIPLAGSHSPID